MYTADCGVPLVDGNITLNYTSLLEGSILTLTSKDDTSTDGEILRLSVTCHSSGNWIPDPTQFTYSPSTTVPPGIEILIHSTPHSSGSKININFITLPTQYYYFQGLNIIDSYELDLVTPIRHYFSQ